MNTQIIYLTQRQVAERLQISIRTLEGWRWRGIGPRFHRFGNAVRYALHDIEAYELSVRY